MGEDLQGFMDFGRGFARICETLGEDSQGFVRICKTLGEDSQGFETLGEDSQGFFGRGFARIRMRLWERIRKDS